MIIELGPDHRFDVAHRSLVMGILNRTPDSFWDRGRFWDFDDFLQLAQRHVDAGADLFDVGGSKAGPGPEVTCEEELDRVIPAVEALSDRFDLPIAVDTFRGAVVDAALDAGASIGNDISGFADPTFLPACARHGAAVVATHVRLGPRIPDPNPDYKAEGGVVAAVRDFLAERVRWAREAGIPDQRIMVDAGLDLGKTAEMSIDLLRNSSHLAELGRPVLLSASNKGFLGEVTGDDLTERVEATWAAHALGISGACRILRSHDVRGARRVADAMAAVLAVDIEVIGAVL
ncbi:MAG: dihydropteroate synthase [Acidimicrobiaceae bacterium]|nr:dihydropteroate synthase [Acidimicrobiaceae bacterium]HAQ23200.1 dihydropteroate synthase [Acidimicrobiaceae bacterium]|tara:strand:+ start:5718 stop:6584 length:867 start_codon:yes stop_codon:yes gene_type:complete